MDAAEAKAARKEAKRKKKEAKLLKRKLEGAAEFCPQDTPTKLLMKEMRARSIDPQTPTAPVDWKGYHDSEV